MTVHDIYAYAETAIVDDGLGASNEAAAPLHEVQPLSCFAKSEAGEVVGGAIGRRWGPCCELQQLWVDPAHRRRGVGARLVRMFEERAASRGCRTYFLETFSFQAPAFYESLGYRRATEFRGFPHGIVRYVMVRGPGPTDGSPHSPGGSLASPPAG
jgi:ribosomal protein S18 acetylase RimI-like enzyme